MKRIAIEEHFYTPAYEQYLRGGDSFPKLETKIENGSKVDYLGFTVLAPGVVDALLDTAEGRLKSMDEAGVDIQVLSLMSPGVEVLDSATAISIARQANDDLSKIVKKNPERFGGFATIPAQEPEESVKEMERAIQKLGLNGIKINSTVRAEFLDAPKFRPIFEKAEELNIPIYLHPNLPPPDMIKPYLAYRALAGSMLAFAHETGLHAMRLICSGLFDEYPGLKIILGHLGEALPFWYWRFDSRWQKEGKPSDPISSKIKRRPSDYIRDNFYVTTSGCFWPPSLLCAYMTLGADRILFAVDYPLESQKEAVAFLDSAPISEGDKEKIYHGNAEKILRL